MKRNLTAYFNPYMRQLIVQRYAVYATVNIIPLILLLRLATKMCLQLSKSALRLVTRIT